MTHAIRLADASDGAAAAEIYAPAVDTPVSFEAIAPDASEMGRRIAAVFPTYPWLVYEAGTDLLGYAYGGVHRIRAAYNWTVEVSVYVRNEFHGRGVGRALYTALFGVLRLQGFRTAVAGITVPNDPSVALHEAFGFSLVGVYHKVGFKRGAWHDVAHYELALSSYATEPAPTIPVTDVDPLVLRRALGGEPVAAP